MGVPLRVRAMTALTIRLPSDKYQRLKELSRQRGTSVSRLMDEMATLMLAKFDMETRFALGAARGAQQQARGLELLRKAAESACDAEKKHPKCLSAALGKREQLSK